jgi:methyl-accepting chemotaxis protein
LRPHRRRRIVGGRGSRDAPSCWRSPAVFGIWALSLKSDLDDQRAQSARVEKEAEAVRQDVQGVSDQVDQVSQSVESAASDLSDSSDQAAQQTQAALTEIEKSIQSLSDRAKTAKDKLGGAIEDAKGKLGEG